MFFDKQKLKVSVIMNGEDYRRYLESQKISSKKLMGFTIIFSTLLMGALTMVMIHSAFAVPIYHQPFFENIASIEWSGILKFLGICLGIGWVLHGTRLLA